MIDIIEVAKRLKDNEKLEGIDVSKDYTMDEKIAIVKDLDYKAIRAINYKDQVSEFKIKESSAKGYKKKLENKLIKILEFVNEIKKIRYRSGCTLIPIADTFKKYVAIFGSRKNVDNYISYMEEMGLIKIWLDSNRFNSGKDNYCKWFLYFKENEDKLVSYYNNNFNNNIINNNNILLVEKCKKSYLDDDLWYVVDENGNVDDEKFFKLLNSINLVNRLGNNILLVEKCKKLIDFKVEDVRFCKGKMFKKVEGISEEDFEVFLNECLYENYKGLKYFQELVDEINETYYRDNDDFKLKFEASFEWGTSKKGYRYVKKIGIRLFNNLCVLRRDRRKEFLEEINYDKEKDVKSSIGRVSVSLSTGEWLDESIDIYKLIFDELNINYDWNDENRELIKSLFMRAYFDKSKKKLVKNIWKSMVQFGINVEDIRESVYKYKDALVKVLGKKTFGSEIYYYESSLYLLVLNDLLSAGYKVWIVYDCFYANTDSNYNLWNDLGSFKELVELQLKVRFDDYCDKYKRGLIWNKS